MKNFYFVFTVLTFLAGCGVNAIKIDPGADPNFTVEPAVDAPSDDLVKKVVVFDIPIYAVDGVPTEKMLHAANIMAQYLDNDEDGMPDNDLVHAALLAEQAFMLMWYKESDLDNIDFPEEGIGQDLGTEETRPQWHANKQGAFDASLEEVLHIITHAGYAKVYPDVFGESPNTGLAKAMDIARGGQYFSIPNTYPAEAWYTYDDETCDYSCMVTEYIYWALTSLLGAQENRFDEIGQEWDLHTAALVEEVDTAVFKFLSDPQYFFPEKLPDGTYKH